LFNLGDFYMKKTLVALAVIAASGASFAQVTISGKLGFSYQKNAVVGGGAANHGMAMSDGDLNFTATEDLGGGYSATAKSAFASRGRDNTFAPRDASLALVTTFGQFAFGSAESCSAILNTAGAPVSLATDHDGGTGPIDACANLDFARFDVPVGPVTLTLGYFDSIGAAGGGAGAAQANYVAANYASGALKLGVDHAVFSAAAGVTKDRARTRLTVSYDLGMAVIGAGIQNDNNDKAAQSSFSLNVPMGALQAGLVYSHRNAQNAGVVNGVAVAAADSRSGTAVGLQYNMSKMTNVNVSYGTYSNNAAMDNEFRVRLMKSF
jgi:hypothetical protein